MLKTPYIIKDISDVFLLKDSHPNYFKAYFKALKTLEGWFPEIDEPLLFRAFSNVLISRYSLTTHNILPGMDKISFDKLGNRIIAEYCKLTGKYYKM